MLILRFCVVCGNWLGGLSWILWILVICVLLDKGFWRLILEFLACVGGFFWWFDLGLDLVGLL